MGTIRPSRPKIKGHLDEITGIKIKALEELTHEDLRGDRMFLIFLMQCGNVINKIQAKIALGAGPGARLWCHC